jgi:hypothetical protein
MRVFNKVTSICPLRYRGDHTATRPATLTQVSVRHINKQVEKLGYGPLPLKTGEYLYQCRDCDAVWHAPSLYISVDESKVLGIYKSSLVWKPYQKAESHRTGKLSQY